MPSSTQRFEEGQALFGPWFIAGHAFVFQAVINLLGSRFDFLVRREVELESCIASTSGLSRKSG